jgi:predicted nucleotidyltransferase
MRRENVLYARALLLRNCGRFTHISSDFGSQYRTHAFASSEALYASLTRGATWRHPNKFVDLKEDAKKSANEDYFFCDYDVKKKPVWFTPGVFVDEELRLLAKQRGVVDRNDFNVVDEGYPGTGGKRVDGKKRQFFAPTYGNIESILPDHQLLTCALSPRKSELEGFAHGQTFLMGKKRTMFQLRGVSEVAGLVETEGDAPIEECQPVQVRMDEVGNFREYEILAGTARYLLVRGRTSEASLAASFTNPDKTLELRRVLPAFWVERVSQILSEPREAANQNSVLAEVVSELKMGLGDDLIAVVLFGSRARGEAWEGSDWDLLVVARNLPERTLQRIVLLKKMLPSAWRGEVSLLAKTPEEFTAGLPELYLDIAVDGVILYDTGEYMARRLQALRDLIRRKGLRREREGQDLIWHWQEPPGTEWSLEWEEGS